MLNGAAAPKKPTHHRTLTKEDAAKLALVLGSGTIQSFQANATQSDVAKKAAEKFDAQNDPFANVARKGGKGIIHSNQ